MALGDVVDRDRLRKNLYKDRARATHVSAGRRFVPIHTSSTAPIGYREFGTTAGGFGADRGQTGDSWHAGPQRRPKIMMT